MPRFEDIKPFTRDANYRVNVSWKYLEEWIDDHKNLLTNINLDPDFQRAHVWDEKKQIAYVEYRLRKGMSGKEIYWNHPTWGRFTKAQKGEKLELVLVDGKQRIEAVRKFMRNELKVFGYYINEYSDKIPLLGVDFIMCVNDLPTRAQVLQWYIEMNSGGVVHTEEEIDKVKALLEAEQKKI